VVQIYTPQEGFTRVEHPVVLTTDVALQLREQGVSTIELVWRRHHRRMTVTAGYNSVWGELPWRFPSAAAEAQPARSPDTGRAAVA